MAGRSRADFFKGGTTMGYDFNESRLTRQET